MEDKGERLGDCEIVSVEKEDTVLEVHCLIFQPVSIPVNVILLYFQELSNHTRHLLSEQFFVLKPLPINVKSRHSHV